MPERILFQMLDMKIVSPFELLPKLPASNLPFPRLRSHLHPHPHHLRQGQP
jgi:hypothetical protein